MDWAKPTARRDEKHLNFGICYVVERSQLAHMYTSNMLVGRLFGTKSLAVTMLDYWTFGNKIQWNFNQETTILTDRNELETVCANGGYIVSASMR